MIRLACFVAFVFGAWFTHSVNVFAQSQPSAKAAAFFETNVRPVLANRCFRCHGEKKQRAGLRLDSLAAMLKGGESGPAIAPGNPKESLLLRAVSYRATPKMPPKSKLPPREIAKLTAWVKMGAPWPNAKPLTVADKANRQNFTKEQLSHWAFHPPKTSPLPSVRNRRWVQSPIDAFILAELEKRGFQPAPSADRRSLLRRATLDLIGLPPTPAEYDSFLNDDSPDAFAKVVDRLLASPHYGERWGRHWLDVARYADSNGMDENLAYVNAFRYRDYVVNASNDDMPYDRFVREQLAGDLLPSPTAAQITATGLLSIGPKMLAEDDQAKMEMDIIDEQLDTIGRAFMGMTLGCARCHDHKFDPITTEDYYGLAGIFKSTQTMDNFRVVAQWHERPAASGSDADKVLAHEKRISALKAKIAKLHESAQRELVAEARKNVTRYMEAAKSIRSTQPVGEKLSPLVDDGEPSAGAVIIEAENFNRGNVKKDRTNYGKKIGVLLNNGRLPNVAEYDINIKQSGIYQLDIRYAAAAARPVVLSINGRVVKRDVAGKITGSWFPNSQRWAVEGVFQLKKGENSLRLECAGPFPHFDKLAFGRSTLREIPKTTVQLAAEKKLNPVFLRQWVRFFEDEPKTLSKQSVAKIVEAKDGPFAIPKDAEKYYPNAVRDELRRLKSQLDSLEKSRPRVPNTMAVADRKIMDLAVHIRGSHLTLGKIVPRHFPTVFARIEPPAFKKTQSGRLELAKWLAHPDHPLTSRVMVNRIWQGHFGVGLVPSLNNFGLLGKRPTNQALLDWLAVRFVHDGWSIKSMHRLIMLSSAYQMSTAFNEKAAKIDPENLLLWRMNRRRLDAESLRDSILAISGELERKMGGSLLKAKKRAYVTGTANRNYDDYNIPRRSIYLPVIRSALYDVFQAFDFPDPSVPAEGRTTTTVPSQALFMMNSDLVHRHTMIMAKSLLALPVDDLERGQILYRKLFGREPPMEELNRGLGFVRRVAGALTAKEKDATARRMRGWQSLCRVLMSSNEFLYVE